MDNRNLINPSQTSINANATPVSAAETQAFLDGGTVTTVNQHAGPVPDGSSTVVNQNATPVGSAHIESADKIGTVFNEKYTIVSKMSSDSGEADLYVCHDVTGKRYCLKHYRRADQVRKEVREILQNLHAPYVAKLIDWGYWDEKIYEVWPLYTNGSLSGKRFNEASVERYIAQMNAAIHAVHECGLVHQDIKPANFMLDDGGNVVLIDFGISGVHGEEGRTHVTQVGRTTEYASPEVLYSEYCWPTSDYYSLGITVYELLQGITPYHNYDKDMLQSKMEDIHDTRIPGINSFSRRMQNLLIGLLQYKKENRWSFEAVCDWLKGEGRYDKWIIEIGNSIPNEKKFKFDGNMYYIPSQLPQLITNMAYQWDIGMSLFDTEGRFERLRQTLKDVEGTEDIYAISNMPKLRGEDSALNYFRKLYQLYPGLTLFSWKRYQYENKEKLGEAILCSLWDQEIERNTAATSTFSPDAEAYSIFRPTNTNSKFTGGKAMKYPAYAELEFWMRNGVVSQYLRFIKEDKLAANIAIMEDRAKRFPVFYYKIAYALSKSTQLRLPSGTFSGKEEFLNFVEGKIKESERSGNPEILLDFCRNEIYDGNSVNAGFQAWVESLGLGGTLSILTGEQ